MATRLRRALLLAALASGCQSNFPNPFERTAPLPTSRVEQDLIFTGNGYAARGGSPREVFAVEDDGSGLARLTFCSTATRPCNSEEAAPAPDRKRIVVRRVLTDTDRDGRLTAADGESLVMMDLARGVEGALTPATVGGTGTVTRPERISGVDWSPVADILVFAASVDGGNEDLFRTVPRPDPDFAQTFNLTSSAAIRERRPRIDPAGSVAVFERIDATRKGEIWIFSSSTNQTRLTSGGTAGEPLPGTPYVVGSDADPDYSPDGQSVVFRRLTGLGNGGLGTWDVMTIRTNRTELAVVATGNAFRGAPDWGPRGIVFNEIDAAAGTSKLVLLPQDGSPARTLVTLSSQFDIAFPRWLP
jgi:hypothetical protein